MSESPVEEPSVADETNGLREGTALCLSGGGYRAMVFHLGALIRLNELKILKSLQRISSVSGGSITAATLGMNWRSLQFEDDIAQNLSEIVVDPIRKLASITIDVNSVGWGILNPFRTVADQIAAEYADALFGKKTLQDLPTDEAGPRFVINATNVKTGAVWRFSRPYMGDWLTGLISNPKLSLATAVAASSAFPPFLSPMSIDGTEFEFDANVPARFTSPEFRDEIVLTDGGVYDNLGLETSWKTYKTILISDGGRGTAPDENPATDWARHSYRLIELLQQQISSLRRRQAISAYTDQERLGTYWGIQTDIHNLDLNDTLPVLKQMAEDVAATPTRLAAMDDAQQERIINWGYAICDAVIRRHYLTGGGLPAPAWPYPENALA